MSHFMYGGEKTWGVGSPSTTWVLEQRHHTRWHIFTYLSPALFFEFFEYWDLDHSNMSMIKTHWGWKPGSLEWPLFDLNTFEKSPSTFILQMQT